MKNIDLKRMEVIFNLIRAERFKQDGKWGEQNHALPVWVGILGEEFGEVCQAINETVLNNADKKHLGGIVNIITELIQTAAVSVAIVECIMRNENIENLFGFEVKNEKENRH